MSRTKKTDALSHSLRNRPHALRLSPDQVDFLTTINPNNFSNGVRYVLDEVLHTKGDLRPANESLVLSVTKGVALDNYDVANLRKLGGSVNKGLQVALANYVSPKLVHFFRD